MDQLEIQSKKYKKGWKIFFYVLVSTTIVAFVIVTVVLFLYVLNEQTVSNPIPIEKILLNKVVGDWYEIARIPIAVQNGCYNSVSSYTILPTGAIQIRNACIAYGNNVIAYGVAYPDGSVAISNSGDVILSPARFTAKFGISSFAYWVIGLDQVDYASIMIGSPERGNLWILSRTKTLDATTYDAYVSQAFALNYTTSSLIKTVQT